MSPPGSSSSSLSEDDFDDFVDSAIPNFNDFVDSVIPSFNEHTAPRGDGISNGKPRSSLKESKPIPAIMEPEQQRAGFYIGDTEGWFKQ